MTQAVARILADVEKLSQAERVELRRTLIEHLPMSEEDLTEEDFGAAARELFSMLDREEEAHAAPRH